MTNDPTAPLSEQTPEQVAEYVDNHIIMALAGADHMLGDRQVAEDYVRDRLVAISDSWPTAPMLVREERERVTSRLRRLLSSSAD